MAVRRSVLSFGFTKKKKYNVVMRDTCTCSWKLSLKTIDELFNTYFCGGVRRGLDFFCMEASSERM